MIAFEGLGIITIVTAAGGMYHQARELDRPLALAAFGTDIADAIGLDPDTLTLPDWEAALRLALDMPRRSAFRRASGRPTPRLLVIDELPYLLTHSPEIPSILQLLHDEAANDPAALSRTVIVCGSALSVMHDLLSGARPLRGRAQVELTMHAFDFRLAREFWGIADPAVAFHVDAIFGGVPGYRPLVAQPAPQRLGGLPEWLAASVLNPASALFNEAAYLLREDPRQLDKAIYHSVLHAVADGHRSPAAIGTAVGRDHNTLRHPLGTLESTGFLTRSEDMLTRKRPTYAIADPIIRFSHVVIDPHRAMLEERDPMGAWRSAANSFSSRVLGPHFEDLSRVWMTRFSGDRWGRPIGAVGSASINDGRSRTQHEIDVVALERGARVQDDKARIVVLGEAKASSAARAPADLARLDHVRTLLGAQGRDIDGCQLVIFSRSGFDAALAREARSRHDVHLIDLATLYGDDHDG
jgi:hypothetical protein